MGYLRTMGAGCAGSTVRYKGVNVNQIQFGDKLQGLPPVTGTRRPHRIYKRKAGGQKPGRDTIFCVNQLGGMMVKNSQFAANADGVKECSNRKNHRHHGHHMTNHKSQGQAHTAISRSVSPDNPASGAAGAFGLLGSFLDLGAAEPGYHCRSAKDAFDGPKRSCTIHDEDRTAEDWAAKTIEMNMGDQIRISQSNDTSETALVSADNKTAYVKQPTLGNVKYECNIPNSIGFDWRPVCEPSGDTVGCLQCHPPDDPPLPDCPVGCPPVFDPDTLWYKCPDDCP